MQIEQAAPFVEALPLDFGALDVIGVLYAETPMAEDGGEEPALPEVLPGWHVNSPWPVVGWDEFLVTPKTPRRVFSGAAATVHYTFDSQEAFEALLAYADLSEPVVPKVPFSITARQAEQALIKAGLFHKVGPAIAAIPDATQRAMVDSEWRRSQVFERDRPALIALAKGALRMTDAQLDQLFILGATL